VDAVKRAVRQLKLMNAEQIGTSYVCIIHPDLTYDLTNDPTWQGVKDYDPGDWYSGEIGRIAGCRFVETTEAKVFHAEDLTSGTRNLTAASASTGTTVTISGTLTAPEQAALVGRQVLINGMLYTIVSATATVLTLNAAATVASGAVIYPGEGGAAGRDVYAVIVLGANAYGTTSVEGGGLQHIVKQLGSGGSSDPLNQRGTVGWKAIKVAKRLIEEYMVRIEVTSTFEAGAN